MLPDDIINQKLDDLKDKMHSMELAQVIALNDINGILKDQHQSLQEHMRRSDTLESQFDMMQKEVKPVLHDVKTGLRFIKWVFSACSFILSSLLVYTKLKK